ncbi:MAG: adenylyltransferase/cytidyltransferase family protein [candidate division Zixibacteria bacterium]|nr:adenylyltransferase/cytidyltransferase family protein [candidate division Zixibacteria bacterium]
MTDNASIVALEELTDTRERLGRIVCTSGGFDPLHPGHASCLIASRNFGDTLVVLVNGDGFLRRKKGKPFMDLTARCRVVACIRGVGYVVPFEVENDDTVCEALRMLRPHVFTKGGDRTDISNIPEWTVCRELGIELVTGVGQAKAWSSSDYLRQWGEFWASVHPRESKTPV